jgi:virulence factor Mce-like protein
MRSKYNIVIVLVYMGIASAALMYMAYKMVGDCALASCQTLNIEFKDSAGLLPTNDVRMAGVTAGQVQRINANGKLAVVSVQVNQQYSPVYKDAKAIVRPKNLLGETYVEIDRGHPGAGSFSNGDTIKLINTITPVQVDEVLNALDPDTRTKLQVVINTLGEASAGRGQDLNVSTGDLKRIAADIAITSTSLNQQQDNIDALLVQFDLVMKTAADYHQQLAQVLTDWNTASTTLMSHDQQLASALGHLNTVLADVDGALAPNTQALRSTVASLPSTIDHTNDFLDISSQVMQTFYNTPGPAPGLDAQGVPLNRSQAFASTQPGMNPGSPLQDGVALFPRLAQVMLGLNNCDMHVYANGYQNQPGATEQASPTCQAPTDASGNAVDPALLTEGFTGHPAGNAVPKDRHYWRVMGMIETADIACSLVSPSTAALKGNAACSAPKTTTGFEKYQPGPGQGAVNTSSPVGTFLQQLWQDFTGGGHA